jgi:hypothetical protein
MKPLVSASVYGLVPLPQFPESVTGERDQGSGPQPALTPDASLELNEDLARCHCKARRRLIRLQWFSTIWRQREADR